MPGAKPTRHAGDPLIWSSTSAATGETISWPVMQESIYNQYRVWHSWTANDSTAVNTTTNTWTLHGFLETNDSSSSLWTYGGLTEEADRVWHLDSWQQCRHTKVRWTPSICHPPRASTPEEIAAEAARREREHQQLLRREARRHRFEQSATQRARELLMEVLTPEQRVELEAKKHFHLTVYDRDGSHRVYRIERGFQGNVKLLDAAGRPIKRYCIHADPRLPYEDQMLAQKLLLEANEKEFLRIANMTSLRAAA